MLQDHKSAWMTQLTSQFRIPSSLMSPAPTRKASTAPLPCRPSRVCSRRTSTWTVVRSTIGAVAVTPRTRPSATVSASGSSRGAAPSPSTWASPATSSSATASSHLTRPSATAHINTCSSGPPVTTEDSGGWPVSHHSGSVSHTGCSLSTSEQLET